MYNEIYKGIINLFNQDQDDEKDMRRIPHFLSINYNFDPLKIINISDIDLGKNNSDIILVLASAPDSNPNIKYSDTIIIDGQVKHLILFNLDAYMSEEPVVKLASLAWSIWETCISITTNIKYFLDPDFPRCVNLTNLVYYAPMFIIIKAIDRLMVNDDITDAKLAAVLSNFYKTMVYPETVRSAKRLLQEASISDILDNSLWLSVTNDVYPYIRFDEINSERKDDGESI